MSKEIIEGNKSIMLFDGWVKKIGQTFDPEHNGGKNDYVYYEKDGSLVKEEDIEFDIVYHQSWNALMPVVEKIQSIDITPAPNYRGYRIEIVPQGYVKIEGFPMQTILTNVSVCGSLISAIWKAVIEFIKRYNQISKP